MKWLFALCSMLLLPLCPRASAWSAPGHMIATAIAYDQLTEAERLKFDAILRGHTKYATWKKKIGRAHV